MSARVKHVGNRDRHDRGVDPAQRSERGVSRTLEPHARYGEELQHVGHTAGDVEPAVVPGMQAPGDPSVSPVKIEHVERDEEA